MLKSEGPFCSGYKSLSLGPESWKSPLVSFLAMRQRSIFNYHGPIDISPSSWVELPIELAGPGYFNTISQNKTETYYYCLSINLILIYLVPCSLLVIIWFSLQKLYIIFCNNLENNIQLYTTNFFWLKSHEPVNINLRFLFF